jgi:hypothetical protein
MVGVAGSMRPLSEVQGQSPGDWVLGGLGALAAGRVASLWGDLLEAHLGLVLP